MPPPTTAERTAAEPKVLRKSCAAAIRSAGEYAPEIEPGNARHLSADLARLGKAMAEASSPAERVRTELRTALHRYQHQAHERLQQMRQKVQASGTAIREFTASVLAGAATHQGGIHRELETLKSVARTADLASLRGALGQACAGIRRSHDQLVRGQRMVTLQLQDEIRTLRDTIAAHKRERERDPDSGAWRRESIDAEIRARLSRPEAFSVLLLSIHNLEKLRAELPSEAILGLFEVFIKRLTAIGGQDVMIARWNPSAFALLVPATGARTDVIRDQVRRRLPGAYAVLAGGISYTLVLDLSVAVIDPAVEFLTKL